jgi:dihydrofolate synthase/folylpolyglutamate synthase
MLYPEAIQFLYDLRLFGAKFGLENTFQLAALAGNPQNRLRFIHVAGTNGKGSTCAMLEGIYRAAGLRVGLFTSPHLVSFRERIQVNRRLIDQNDVVRLVEELKPLFKHFPHGHQPTFFEVVTVMALKFFAEQKCELVIWEAGLGGRLDATNIVTPLACLLTNIQLDHQQWLGDTLGKIAAEKAGIIKPGVPVLTATDEPEALTVIEQTAREKKASLTKINLREGRRVAVPNQNQSGSPTRRPSQIGKLSLPGEHQETNAALALATVELLQKQIPVGEVAIRAGLENVDWPGRLQLITRESGQKVLLDGAHNPAGAKTLSQALKKNFHAEKPTLILGILQDKDWQHICETLAPLAMRIFTVPVSSERSANPEVLAAVCRNTHPSGEVISCPSLGDALDRAAGDRFVIITGSLYLVGEALECLGLSPAGSDERGLNEWTGQPAVLFPG